MKLVIFGATGMVGQAALLEAQKSDLVSEVIAVVRKDELKPHRKLKVIVHQNLRDLSPHAQALEGVSGVIYAIGVTSTGMSEEEYTKQTFDMTLSVAKQMLAYSERNKPCSFVYVSGAGADSSENGSVMWARVRGKTENTLMTMPFAGCNVVRPSIIIPEDGIQSKTKTYRLAYNVLNPVLPLLRKFFPSQITTSRILGAKIVHLALASTGKRIFESKDI